MTEPDKTELSVLHDDVPGHTKYLQGIDMTILVNSINDGGQLKPSAVSEMHIAEINGEKCLVITPEIVG